MHLKANQAGTSGRSSMVSFFTEKSVNKIRARALLCLCLLVASVIKVGGENVY
jgi:preprotein translocase subunit Sec61beta